MNAFALALVSLAAGLSPPASWEAEIAVARHYAEQRGESDLSVFGGINPVSVSVDRCDVKDGGAVPTRDGLVRYVAGFVCALTISRPPEPRHQVSGFLHHDGLEWRYFGPVAAPLVATTDKFGDDAFSVQTPKPGSILYNGRAGVGFQRNPYAPILSGYDWVFNPVETQGDAERR